MALRIDDISLNTIIGNGTSITGNLKVNGFVRIDGDIKGDLETDGNIIVGEKARIKGNITANSIIVGGIILGDIYAKESVKILTDAAVVGDIISRKVQIDDLAIFHGHCIALKDDKKYETATETFLQAKAIKKKAALVNE